jgi:hypothetical protein
MHPKKDAWMSRVFKQQLMMSGILNNARKTKYGTRSDRTFLMKNPVIPSRSRIRHPLRKKKRGM